MHKAAEQERTCPRSRAELGVEHWPCSPTVSGLCSTLKLLPRKCFVNAFGRMSRKAREEKKEGY